MGYGNKIFQAACQELERRKRQAEELADRGRERFYEQCPRAREIREEMAQNAAGAAKAVLSGGDVRAEISRMKDRGLALKAEFNQLLAEHHLTEADVTPQYQCLACRDTGFVDGRMCTCLKSLQRRMAFEKLSMSVPLENCTFESFSLDYYKDDERAYRQMEKVFAACKSYGEKFRADSPSLLFKGGTGLGKTHLSLAIAEGVAKAGHLVMYVSAPHLMDQLELGKFHKDDAALEFREVIFGCDLLVIDDLGTELVTRYTQAEVYDLVNHRLNTGKPTIINTNLGLQEIERTYSSRVHSRLAGMYAVVQFRGRDIRLQKKQEG